jgi:hypothetical protein
MKKLFYVGILLLICFEIANVYFIMPMPGSQRMRSIDAAYFLYEYRWIFRVIAALLILISIQKSYQSKKWVTICFLATACVTIYTFNFYMAADCMFYQPTSLLMLDKTKNKVNDIKLIIGIVENNEARAYPIQYIGYHHQVKDSIMGKPIIVTYCTVCRTGRVFEPIVNGKTEAFRLVGMDHFNAMFEDLTTHSWWRQANGEAIKGRLKGKNLPEILSQQMTLKKWLSIYPNSKIMQPDTLFKENYEKMSKFDIGNGNSDLTKRDSLSWKEKSWVVGINLLNSSLAVDWNRLLKERIVNKTIKNQSILLVLADDNTSFFAYEKPDKMNFKVKNDTLTTAISKFTLDGKEIGGKIKLRPIASYQEFWHSWKTFHPETSMH